MWLNIITDQENDRRADKSFSDIDGYEDILSYETQEDKGIHSLTTNCNYNRTEQIVSCLSGFYKCECFFFKLACAEGQDAQKMDSW